MADVATPIAACIATGVAATCAQAVISAVWPELPSYGLTWPSLAWGLMGGYAGEMLRRLKAEEEGKPHRKLGALGLILSAGFGALAGNWVGKAFLPSDVKYAAEAIAGSSAFFAATWQWLLLALLPAIIEAAKTVIARWASK